jgi:hypothetical protein
VYGADREDIGKAKSHELGCTAFGAFGVYFVYRDDNFFAAAPQAHGRFVVQWDNAFADIDYENYDICGFNREFDLVKCGFGDDVRGFLTPQETDATGIHQCEGTAPPLGFGGDTIAGDPWLIVDYGNAATDDAVEEGGLPNVWTTDYGNETWHIVKMEHCGE